MSLFPQWAVSHATLEAQIIHHSQDAFLSVLLLLWLEVLALEPPNLEPATQVLRGRLHIKIIEEVFVLSFTVLKHLPTQWTHPGQSTSCHGPPFSYAPRTTSPTISAKSEPWGVAMTTLIRDAPCDKCWMTNEGRSVLKSCEVKSHERSTEQIHWDAQLHQNQQHPELQPVKS